ncbi:MAG: Spy/CpxP family protein refolding chaperone [Spirochaetia bacterium]|nr:Spy/CpxP family protein refolding chaperone [Spirochaetia bacterium]
MNCKCKKNISKKKKIMAISFIAVFLIAGVFCEHRPCHKGFGEKHINRMIDKISSKLNLNEVQEEKLYQIKNNILTKTPELEKVKSEMHEVLANQADAETFDKDAVNKVFEKNSQIMKDFRIFMVDQIAAFHAVLNDEQKKELAEHIKSKKEKCEE